MAADRFPVIIIISYGLRFVYRVEDLRHYGTSPP
jgi:hypothetical protein